ncbi:hypothetical protein EKD02_03325 [Chlorobium phaeovibrioides]|uniref:Uncharacterized protein n=2 Tax=Chlorobium phaeovibrioides TaxID=1094 RepID=A0A432AW60_CHLPH|nr:hypothetical protein EKD02_03325 [Chlorobium phaeovibrioides]
MNGRNCEEAKSMMKDAMGGYRGTELEISRMILDQPGNAEGWFNRGNARSSSCNWAGAVADYTMALKMGLRFREMIVAYGNRGLVRAKMGNMVGAIEDFSAIINLRPNNARLYRAAFRSRAEMKEKRGDAAGAAEDRRMAEQVASETAAQQ